MRKEKELKEIIKELEKIIVKEKGEKFYQNIRKKMKEKEQNDFMNGYRYAVRILEESMLNKK